MYCKIKCEVKPVKESNINSFFLKIFSFPLIQVKHIIIKVLWNTFRGSYVIPI